MSGFAGRLHFIPSDAVVGVLAMLGCSAFEFRSLFGAESPGIRLITDAVPDLFDQ
jgi:hypothetical protein